MFFSSFESIKDFINADIKAKDLSCVRYINVETMEMWVRVKAYLTTVCSDFIKLSDFCEEEDTTPNMSRFKNKLKNVKKNTLVTPLSEHIRVNNPVAQKTLEEILKLDYENNINNNLKVYIPIYRMKSLIKNLTNDKRYQKSILFIETESDCDYSLTIIQDTLNVKIPGNEIIGYKKYLTYWEQNPDKPIILYTQNAIHYTDIVFDNDVKVIVNAFELLKHHYKLGEKLKSEWGTDDQWMEIIKHLHYINNLEQAFMNILLVPKFDVKILDYWNMKSPFEKWIFWLWSKTRLLNGYLKVVIERSNIIDDFENLIYNSITNIVNESNYKQLYSERKNILQKMNLKATPGFWDCLESLSGYDKLKCLTDITDKEKSKIFDLLKKISIDEEVQKILEIVYLDLYLYLSSFNLGTDEFNNYFAEYKKQKIQNVIFDNFQGKVKSIAKKQCWWNLEPRNVIVNQIYDDDKVIFYVDALGVEYLKLLVEKIEKNNVTCNVQIGYCNIPSTTENNNDFYKCKNNKKNYELDELKHKKNDYPQNIIKEINLINKISDDAVALMEDYKQVIIASDHGASRLAVLADCDVIKAFDSSVTYKYGRYCIDKTKDYSAYETCIEKNGCWTWADYSRFSSQGAPLGETHGGALLEEVLVPIITISKGGTIVKEETSKVVISLLTQEIKLTANQKIKVEFKLSESLQDVVAVVNNNRYQCIYSNGKYSFEPDIDRNSEYTAKIVAKEIIGTIKYKVIKGLISNFDI
jgi:hypothetical protein